jgi:hypothetical protein
MVTGPERQGGEGLDMAARLFITAPNLSFFMLLVRTLYPSSLSPDNATGNHYNNEDDQDRHKNQYPSPIERARNAGYYTDNH